MIDTRLVVCMILAAAVQVGNVRADEWPRALTCAFSAGVASTQVDGAFKQTAAVPLSFEIKDIDLEGQIAATVGKAGAAPGTLRIVRALGANHFIEVLSEGFLSLTTVYNKVAATGSYPAVHSRHIGVVGQAVVAQYTGSCK